MVPPPESAGFIPFDLEIPDPPAPLGEVNILQDLIHRSPVYVPPLPKECYDATFGRIHVQPGCRCPKVKGKRK